MLDAASPKEYLIGHLEEALTKDARLSEQGLHVSIEDQPLVVTIEGVVSYATNKNVLADVIRGLLPTARIEDHTTMTNYPEPTGPEGVA